MCCEKKTETGPICIYLSKDHSFVKMAKSISIYTSKPINMQMCSCSEDLLAPLVAGLVDSSELLQPSLQCGSCSYTGVYNKVTVLSLHTEYFVCIHI